MTNQQAKEALLFMFAWAVLSVFAAIAVGDHYEHTAFHCGRAFQKAYPAYGNLDGCGRYVEWMER